MIRVHFAASANVDAGIVVGSLEGDISKGELSTESSGVKSELGNIKAKPAISFEGSKSGSG